MKKDKQGKTLLDGVRFSFSVLWKESRTVTVMCSLAVIARVLLPYLGILMPKVVLDQIAAGAGLDQFLLAVGGMALALVGVNFLKAFSDEHVDHSVGIAILDTVSLLGTDKRMSMDYENMDNPEYIKLQSKVEKACYSNRAPAMNVSKMAVEVLSNGFGFILFAATIAVVHPLILAVLAVTSAVNWLVMLRVRKYMEDSRERRSALGKKLAALDKAMRDPGAAKDMRLYGASAWLIGLYKAQYGIFRSEESKLLSKEMNSQLTDALMILLRDGVAYALLITQVINGSLSLGDFVFAFAAVGALGGWISRLLTASGDISKACIELEDVHAELSYPDKMNTGVGTPISDIALPPSIELRNVSYQYPEAEQPTLRDINITVLPGEKIAIVGVNGAGKTTLIKIICGLYLPTEGEVLLSGHAVSSYNRDEYYTLFSAVFQDIHLLASSIADNISSGAEEQADNGRVWRALELSGLDEKVKSLPEREHTMMVRSVNADAIELSGGEKQKLAMARALYKDAAVLLLDEPTAALDPLAEDEVYRKYAELTQGKTSIFISHRLASTRFCDRILLIDGNTIAEQGTHDELMELGGIYAGMFEMQASYYSN